MTKEEVLQDIDRLCGEIDKWNAMGVDDKEDAALCVEKAFKLVESAHKKLSFLRGYIEDNVKEE